MKVLSSVKTLSPRTVAGSLLVMLGIWWTINSFVNLAVHGQGWPSLAMSVLMLVLSAMLLPQDHIIRSFLREVWAKA